MKRVSGFLFIVIFVLGVMPAMALAAPKDLKAAAASKLQELSPDDTWVKKRIDRAIQNIEESVTDAY